MRKSTQYAFVREDGTDGKLVPVSLGDTPSNDELLEAFHQERQRTAESLARAGSKAVALERRLRRSDSQQKIKAVTGAETKKA